MYRYPTIFIRNKKIWSHSSAISLFNTLPHHGSTQECLIANTDKDYFKSLHLAHTTTLKALSVYLRVSKAAEPWFTGTYLLYTTNTLESHPSSNLSSNSIMLSEEGCEDDIFKTHRIKAYNVYDTHAFPFIPKLRTKINALNIYLTSTFNVRLVPINRWPDQSGSLLEAFKAESYLTRFLLGIIDNMHSTPYHASTFTLHPFSFSLPTLRSLLSYEDHLSQVLFEFCSTQFKGSFISVYLPNATFFIPKCFSIPVMIYPKLLQTINLKHLLLPVSPLQYQTSPFPLPQNSHLQIPLTKTFFQHFIFKRAFSHHSHSASSLEPPFQIYIHSSQTWALYLQFQSSPTLLLTYSQ